MSDFLLAVAGIILLTVAIGLWRVLRGPDDVDRTLAAQLLGTGGIAVLLLAAAGTRAEGAEDVALGLALLAAFASVAFATGLAADEDDGPDGGPRAQDR
jgi:multicomponent Na+:H+ antiporter subunit F